MNDALLAGQFGFLLPEILLAAAACAIFLGGTFRSGRTLWSSVALFSLAAALAALWFTASLPSPGDARTATFATPFIFDSLAGFGRVVALVGGIILVLMSWNEVPDSQAADYMASLLV